MKLTFGNEHYGFDISFDKNPTVLELAEALMKEETNISGFYIFTNPLCIFSGVNKDGEWELEDSYGKWTPEVLYNQELQYNFCLNRIQRIYNVSIDIDTYNNFFVSLSVVLEEE